MNLKIIFLYINTVTAVTAHNHLRHKPEQNQITSFQNTKGELSRLLLLKGSERLLPGSSDLGSCSKDNDCGNNQKCDSGSKDEDDGECKCESGYEEVGGECVEDVGSGGDAAPAQATAASRTTEDQAVIDCFEKEDGGAKDALDDDDDKKVEENLGELFTECEALIDTTTTDDEDCVLECIEDIVKECKDDLKDSGDGTGGSKDYDDCKHLDDDLIKCLEDRCYPE
jgi:hypothetical protein